LKNLLNDREIINFGVPAPLQRFIASKISAKRSKIVAPHYQKMGGGSPQLALTQELLAKVAPLYKEKSGRELDTFTAMCYWHPYIEDTVKTVMKGDYDRIILLPMYPQYSSTTTGACFNRFNRAISKTPPRGVITRVSQFHTDSGYLKSLALRIQEAAARLDKGMGGVHLLFSAHSLPQSVIDAGDPYLDQIYEQIGELVKILEPRSFSLAFQSKLGRMKWLTPSVTDEMKRLAQLQISDIVVLAISFVNDHIETLIELDDDLIPKGRELGLKIERAETLNAADDFAESIAKLLVGV
ncbi:MAG: ferrochelatase, partial [Deferribacteraceae bacterium]|jgi:ferrochelatase|nr:ferrochelatase [Deferribacteraceae bacterium]